MTKRIALIGYFLEVNSFSPVTREVSFRSLCHKEGEAITALMRAQTSVLPLEVSASAQWMDQNFDWEPVPISVLAATPGGPADQEFYEHWLAEVRERLEAAGPLDGVYIANHGAGAATRDHDSDGTLYAMVRAIVGQDTPIVATLDLHANISERMVEAADMMIAYRTNPHVDQRERAQEAARAMKAMLKDGLRPVAALIRLPICPPSVTLLTAEGPYADLIDHGQTLISDEILNVSVFGGFVFSDLPKNGIAVVVSARSSLPAAREACLEIARRGWGDRHRYRRELTSLDDAVALAVTTGADEALPANIFAEVGDNPGGGGSGRTTWLLSALHAAGATGVLCGVFHDPALAGEAHRLGEGAAFTAVFNRDAQGEFDQRFEAKATVLRLHDGQIVGRRGNRRGRIMPHGPSCLLRINGIQVAVSSNRLQCYDPAQFEMYGAGVGAARTVVVKSRGHFRAGFDEFFASNHIFEIDTPGLTSPVLSRFDFKHLPRPCYPLDADAHWVALACS